MGRMDNEQIIVSSNAARMHCLQDQGEYCGGFQWKLGGVRYFHDTRGPTAWRGETVNRYKARATWRKCTFFKFGAELCGGDEWKLGGDRYCDHIRGPTAWRL
jgi:hypothetical protein